MVAVYGGNAHFGHDGQHAVDRGLDIVFPSFLAGDFPQFLLCSQFFDGFQCYIRIDGGDAIADEGAEVMDFPWFP